MPRVGDLRYNNRSIFQMYQPAPGFILLAGVPLPVWAAYPQGGWRPAGFPRKITQAEAVWGYSQGARNIVRVGQLLQQRQDRAEQGGGPAAAAAAHDAGAASDAYGGGGDGGALGGDFGLSIPEGWGGVSAYGQGDGEQNLGFSAYPLPTRQGIQQALLKLGMSEDANAMLNLNAVPIDGDTISVVTPGYSLDTMSAFPHICFHAPGTTLGRGEFVGEILVTGAVGNRFKLISAPSINGSASWDSSAATAVTTVAGSKKTTLTIGSGGFFLIRFKVPVQVGDGTASQLAVALGATGMDVQVAAYPTMDSWRGNSPKLMAGGN